MRTGAGFGAGAAIATSLVVASLAAASAPAVNSGSGPSGLIAFTRGHHAYLMHTDGSGISPLSCGGGVNQVAWSPDGQRLACGGFKGIVVVNADGSGATRVSTQPVVSVSWSPDGGRIALSFAHRLPFTYPDGKRAWTTDIAVIDADGGNLRQLTNTPKLWESRVDWSPAGGRLAFERSIGLWTGHVCVMKTDGSGVRDLNPTGWTRYGGAYKVYSGMPDWSPDGRRIAFSYYDPYYGLGDIWVMDANGKGLVKLTHNWMEDGSSDWSSDGRRIVFVRSARGAVKSQIVVMNANGTGKKALTPGKFTDGSPAWQPVAS